MKHRTPSTSHQRRNLSQQRRGSTLMIVIVLLGLLSILGVLFYTFAAQERSNAEYFASGSKNTEDPGLVADALFDFGLEQLIVGTAPHYKQSALWGSQHSMLANALGVDKNQRVTDTTPFNGQGVHIVWIPGTGYAIDQDYNGTADSGSLLDSAGNTVNTRSGGSFVTDLLGLNSSPAANSLFERQTDKFPQPDVGYTYPDNNTPFLAYLGWTRDRNTGTVRTVLIPSFHRPQLNRDSSGTPIPIWEDLNYSGSFDGGDLDDYNPGTLDYGAVAGNRLFRPHPAHRHVPAGQQNNSNVSRFISTVADAQALLGDGKRVFPFFPMYPGYNPSAGGTGVTYTGRPATWVGHQGVWSGPHPTDTARNDDYQYDVDNDGDDIRDGIWIDLDFPPQELPDGTLVVPLFSFTVYDLDALFNLSAHGNIHHLRFSPNVGFNPMAFNNNTQQFGTNPITNRFDFISASNHGLQPSEVNFAWGLTGRPGLDSSGTMASVFAQYAAFFGQLPVDSSTLTSAQQAARDGWFETANMDLAYLKVGRPLVNTGTGTVDDLYPGLHGEEHLISQNFSAGNNFISNFPQPGRTQADDNQDLNEGMLYSPRQVGQTWLDVEQPQDWSGIGSETQAASPEQLNRIGTGRVRWTAYAGSANNGNVFWGNAAVNGSNLMTGSQSRGLYEDPSETALHATDRRDVDDPFTPEDAAYLALDNNDILNLGLKSRLTDLASFNFATSGSTNSRGETIRKRFTTLGNDRKNYSLPRTARPSGTTDRRYWEWNDDQGNTTATVSPLRFPPVFGPVGSAIARYSTLDPFRPEVRYLLSASIDDPNAKKQFQQKLSVNKVLTSQNRQLIYRDPTQHSDDPGATAIPSTAGQPANSPEFPYPPSDAISQEYWARRDRQQMARDIYVLLYTLGSGQDAVAAATTTVTGTTVYTDRQLEQMARFAVNLVDAQDRDNVFTRFEYDKDLSDGWNLDDNPYTLDAGGDRAEVWGVERQELTFSEVLAFQTSSGGSNNSNTKHDDMETRQFVTIELRNVAPYDVKFTDKDTWQVVMKQVEPGDASYNAATHPLKERRLTLRNTAGSVVAGEFYTIFSTDRDDTTANPSSFQVDPNYGGAPSWIAPNDSSFAGSASASGHHIDLVEDVVSSGSGFQLTDGASPPNPKNTAGDFLTDTTPGTFVLDPALTSVRWVLRRRAHPTRSRPTTSAEEADNPWVEIDRIEQSGTMPIFTAGTDAATMQTALRTLISQERSEPLLRATQSFAPAGNVSNSFAAAGENSRSTPTQFQYTQVHPDRPFGSMGEVLAVPLVGPPPYDSADTDAEPNPWATAAADRVLKRDDGLTTYFAEIWATPSKQIGVPAAYPSTYFFNSSKSGLGAFLNADYPDSINASTQLDTCWHRVLELLEVPTRTHRNLNMGTEFSISRVPGRINLNTIRHPEVLAGLIDNQLIADLNMAPYATATPNYPSLTDVANGETYNGAGTLLLRDWFQQLQNSRDPQDPHWASLGGGNAQDLRLPGLPTNPTPGAPKALPFRSMGYMDDGKHSVQHTLLRTLPIDSAQTSKRQLFEVGTQTENDNGSVDLGLRHQVLSKIWGNTTVRSNSFVVFMSVKLFRAAVENRPAVDPTMSAVRIGGPYREYDPGVDENPELPEYRGVFIVDRSKLENGTTSFRPYVLHRKTIVEP